MIFKLSWTGEVRRPRRTPHDEFPGEVMKMGKFCEVCEKGLMTGHNVSHSNRKSSRTWAPNVQPLRVIVDGRPMRLNVCTRCLRTMRKNGAMQAFAAPAVETAAEEA